MAERLKIAVADDEPDMLEYFSLLLSGMGHDVVALVDDGVKLVEECRRASPDLIIADVKMPQLDGIDAAAEIWRWRRLPVIFVSAYYDAEYIARAGSGHALAYLVKPVKQENLAPAIALAMRRFEELEQLRHETSELKQALEDRKTIERAKGILMKRSGMDEEQAFRRMQRLASDNNRKLVEVARMICLAEEASSPP